jgi:hypothetical protein
MSDSQENSTTPAFQPLGTAASLRMLDSVMNRVESVPLARSVARKLDRANEASVVNNTMSDAGDQKHSKTNRRSGEPQTVLEAGWNSSQADKRETVAPLWSNLPKTDLKPVVTAIETDLGAYLALQRENSNSGRSGSPEMTLLAGQSDAASIRAFNRGTLDSQSQQAAVDVSTRLLDAVRKQASTQAIAGDNQISLGDLTLIAFADSKRQMAAATSHAEHVPDTHPLKKAIDNSANKKMMESSKGFETKLKKVAELTTEALEKAKRIAKERFGSHG